MTRARVWDDRPCHLGEGPLWHPERGQLFWFDILGRRLMTRDADGPRDWAFDEPPSAAGWIDRDALMLATATGFWRFDLRDGTRERLAPLQADDPTTRSNDGRADPHGGFWVGTMGTGAEPGRGAIHRYHRGEVRTLHEGLAIPNAICFAPDGGRAFFADTRAGIVMAQRLGRDGWPDGDPDPFVDLSGVGLNPDGAVIDADGNLWVAQWGAWRVACHGPDGRFRRAVEVGAAHASCPAFGGDDLRTLFVTSAREGLPADAGGHHVDAGRTFALEMDVTGLPEPRAVP